MFLSDGHCLFLLKRNTRVGSIYVLLGSPTLATPTLIIQVNLTLSKDSGIGTLEPSLVCCMSKLKFDYLEPGIMIIQ